MIVVDLWPLPTAKRVDLGEEGPFDLGGLRVRPAELAVTHDGERRELQPRAMQVLVALAKARPEVVSRDRLIEQCWEGRVVGDDAVNRIILSLRHLAQEFTPAPFSIETVPRVGHRLIVDEKPASKGTRRIPRRWLWAGAAALLLLLVAGGFFAWQQRQAVAEPASIAVLPFRNLSSGDPYFAEGIGEEILGQLAREPHFRVAGSNSSSQVGPNPNARDVARRLRVDYVLEGSVRKQGNRVRVNAGLVRASDGIRLWSDSYDGKLDDIFAIQQQIGSAIASALQRKLVRAPALSGALVTKGEAYNLYLTARALIRTRNRRSGPTAADLLRDAIQIDPGYAPAWASLAEAAQMQGALGDYETFIAATRKARDYARRAIALAPELADGHRALGHSLGYGDPEGTAQLRRAAALDPKNAENLIALGAALEGAGEFDRELAVYRRAHELDPFWYRTTGATAVAMATRGDRSAAEALARRDLPDKQANLHILLGRIAWVLADYSEAARQWAIVAASNSPRWAPPAQRTFYDATNAVGISTGRLEDVPYPASDRPDWRVWMDAPPPPAVWRQRNRDTVAGEVYRRHNLLAAKLMLNAGRWKEVASTYDGPAGLFGLVQGRHVRVDQVREVPVVALALRKAGRETEANRLLREADAAVRAVDGKGAAPFWFYADAATVFAVEGRKDEALGMLERAFARGWRQNGSSELRDIRKEPAFAALLGDARFNRIAAAVDAHYSRERREVEQVIKSRP